MKQPKEFHDIRIPLPVQRHTALRQAAVGAQTPAKGAALIPAHLLIHEFPRAL